MSEEFGKDGQVVPVCFMGAPVILYERLLSGTEGITALHAMENFLQLPVGASREETCLNATDGKVDIETGPGIKFISDFQALVQSGEFRDLKGLVVLEAGGMNCMEPLILSAQTQLPIVDADCMGRAFPQLQHVSAFIYGQEPAPCVLADEKGRRAFLFNSDDPIRTEEHFRKVCIEMGCAASIVFPPMTSEQVQSGCVLHSLSRVWRLGDAVLKARRGETKKSPIHSILRCESGKVLGEGKITDVERRTEGGFNFGKFTVRSGAEDDSANDLLVDFQNENLIARRLTNKDEGEEDWLASVPDLICMVDVDSGAPIMTEELHYGMRVAVLCLASHPLMTSDLALKFVGPQVFGYERIGRSSAANVRRMQGWTDTRPIPQ